LSVRNRVAEVLQKPGTSWIVLACSLVLTFAAWRLSDRAVDREAESLFEDRTEDLSTALEARMGRYKQVLMGSAALFQASESLSRQEFQTYISTLHLGEAYPGIQCIGLSLRVLPDGLAKHVASVRSEGFADYKVWPEGARDEYFSTVYVEPFAGPNSRTLGFDMRTEDVRKTALELARDTGQPSLSGAVQLLQEIPTESRRGVLIYLPLYAKGWPLATVEERRAALLGFVYSSFRLDDLLKGILGNNLEGARLRV
jgi:CHASE1-domain containing sensor protein